MPLRKIKKLNARHHLIARMIARGYKDVHIARELGISPVTVGNLKRDLAGQELIKQYQRELAEDLAKFDLKLQVAANLAADELLNRLTAQPEAIATRDLRQIVSDGADRFGPIKRQHVTMQHEGLGDRLEAALRRAERVIEGEATVVDESPFGALGE